MPTPRLEQLCCASLRTHSVVGGGLRRGLLRLGLPQARLRRLDLCADALQRLVLGGDLRLGLVERNPVVTVVDQDQRVAVRPDRSRVPVLRLQPPDEPGAPLGEGVDLGERGHELGHDRLIGLAAGAGDVDLGEVKVAHQCTVRGEVRNTCDQ